LSLPAGGSFGAPDPLFIVTIPIGTAAKSYTGMFEILGGPGAADMSVLADVNYTVNVTSAVPEPSTVFLAGGTLGLAALLSRRRMVRRFF
jgi:PEP-CTERM motif